MADETNPDLVITAIGDAEVRAIEPSALYFEAETGHGRQVIQISKSAALQLMGRIPKSWRSEDSD